MESVAAASRLIASADEALIQRAARGDVAAFDILIASRLARCHRVAWSIVQHDADAADIVQEAVVAAWRALPRLRDIAAFDGWLNRIVANHARMSRRHRTRLREVTLVPPSDDLTDAPPTDTHRRERSEIDGVVERDAMRRAFDRLTPDQRVILVLHHVEGRPVAEIGRALGIPSGTVKSRLHAARKALEWALGTES